MADEIRVQPTTLQEALRLASSIVAPALLDDPGEGKGIPYALVPDGFTIASLEGKLLTPRRMRRSYQAGSLDGLIAYVSRFKEKMTSAYFHRGSLDVLIDHPAYRTPSWESHVAKFGFPMTPEWQVWTTFNKKAMSQAEFASFIEDNLPDIYRPDGATMLQVATTLEAKRNVSVSSAQRLSDGQVQVSYVEDIRGTASKGTLEIPETFELFIEPFKGAGGRIITARLRWRVIDGGKFSMWYDLYRVVQEWDKAVEKAVARFSEEAGIDQVYEGQSLNQQLER